MGGGHLMHLINFAQREAQIKIVYYGPPLAGKTTSLQYLAKRAGVEIVEMATAGEDRTVFFDYSPITQQFGTWSVKFNFYTLPGQPRYERTRSLVLKGVDGIVFVADSLYEAAEENLRMLADLQEKLEQDGHALAGLSSAEDGIVPVILFYNKRDLKNIMPVVYMDAMFDVRNWGVPRLAGCALSGENVLNAADGITSTVMKELAKNLGVQEEDEDEQESLNQE
jgi:mutual gliding-motility protein MglA